ncbi:MAG: phosphodiester glycosidase family protein [Calothrix sp. MO_192.B10]|nr:phosphodiester glycosidase family protein [Calothrix sp. MO_192.B10]
MSTSRMYRRSFLLLSGATLTKILTPAPAKEHYTVRVSSSNSSSNIVDRRGTVKVDRGKINGISFYRTTIDLTDPNTFISIGLANNASLANTQQRSSGDEEFRQLVARHSAAVVASGTFFAKSKQKAVMGNMVAGGKFLKYSQWENFGTTLGLRAGNQPEMVTARVDGTPQWHQHWFSLTCGPRLLRKGKIWLKPDLEGFKDPHVLGRASRSAIGFPASGKHLILVTFNTLLTLPQEARAMKAIGCAEAMNLDGGSSNALAVSNKILVPARRPLTNVILIYDGKNPPPEALKQSWERFQKGDRPPGV